ncbi:hypothetical protein NPX13_g1220 [Xylaria arbuscula]|uniref:Rhodopsin domain-containing protein n=1 Tax=Xylaria arbuscula TaxID=114810 RepID=A0A9W8NN45_9PEZI|nr:hypothetical protein NPX13_g1220 [Xylaria arbuscula]
MDGLTTLIVALLLIGLGIISVALRFYTRVFSRQGVKWDDCLLLLALIAGIAVIVITAIGAVVDPNGPATTQIFDPDYVDTPQHVFFLRTSFASATLYFTINGAVKSSVLLMYYRIFYVKKWFRYPLFVTIGLVIGWWIGNTVAALTSCIPLDKYWTNNVLDLTHCFSFNVFWAVPRGVRVTSSLEAENHYPRDLLAGRLCAGHWNYQGRPWLLTIHSGVGVISASLPIYNPLLQRILGSPFVAKLSRLFSTSRIPVFGEGDTTRIPSNDISLEGDNVSIALTPRVAPTRSAKVTQQYPQLSERARGSWGNSAERLTCQRV